MGLTITHTTLFKGDRLLRRSIDVTTPVGGGSARFLASSRVVEGKVTKDEVTFFVGGVEDSEGMTASLEVSLPWEVLEQVLKLR